MPRKRIRTLAIALTSAVFTGVFAGALMVGGAASGQEYVPTADLEHPKIRYADSLASLNDRCPVREGKLSPNYLPVYVNGQPIGFC